MLELVPRESDDVDFLELIEWIVNGALQQLQLAEVYLVHVDNWFDFKWLGWWSWGKGNVPARKVLRKLYVPPFNPNRVLSEQHFCWDADRAKWMSVAHLKPLHLRQPGRSYRALPLERWSESAAFIWYSGNTAANTAGSLMLYLSGAEAYAWYASFVKKELWQVDGVCRTTTRELASFEESGRQMAFP
jgi:hypothetical protein